jgi:hypothetical protein
MVLAEPTAEVAVTEEDGAGPARAGNGRLFPMVQLGKRDLELLRRAAYAEPGAAVNAAVERARATFHVTLYRRVQLVSRKARSPKSE